MACCWCWVPDQILGELQPLPSVLLRIIRESYGSEPAVVQEWAPVAYSSSLTVYADGRNYIVGVRGTTTLVDLEADARIAFNELDTTQRWRADLSFLQAFQAVNPGAYFGVGHSLGGSIIDLFLERGMLCGGRSYNPTIQPGGFDVVGHQRVYNDTDPLYILVGQFDRNAIVRKNTSGCEPHGIASFSEA